MFYPPKNKNWYTYPFHYTNTLNASIIRQIKYKERIQKTHSFISESPSCTVLEILFIETRKLSAGEARGVTKQYNKYRHAHHNHTTLYPSIDWTSTG